MGIRTILALGPASMVLERMPPDETNKFNLLCSRMYETVLPNVQLEISLKKSKKVNTLNKFLEWKDEFELTE